MTRHFHTSSLTRLDPFQKRKMSLHSLFLTLRASTARSHSLFSVSCRYRRRSHFSLKTDKTGDVTRSQLLNMLSVLDITKFLEKVFYLNSSRKAKEKIKEVGGACVLLA